VHKVDSLPPSCAVVTKSGNLYFLKPSGPVQACNGTVLPTLKFTIDIITPQKTPDFKFPVQTLPDLTQVQNYEIKKKYKNSNELHF